MKQAIKKAEVVKELTTKTAQKNVQEASKTEKPTAQNQQNINLFDRFLEASCDCV